MPRRFEHGLSVSVLAHGLVLSAAVLLMTRDRPMPAPPDATVALVYEQAPAPIDAAPAVGAPAAVEPPAAPETPTPAEAAPADERPASAEPSPSAEPSAQAPPPVAPSAEDTEAPKLPAPWLPQQRDAPSHPVVRRSAPATPAPERPTPSAGETAAGAPTPAHPVSGMETTRPPVYPEIARRRGEQGRVLLQVAVAPDGVPASVSVTQSSGSPRLDAAAKEAVERWRFVPATRAGVPVASTADVPIRFLLKD